MKLVFRKTMIGALAGVIALGSLVWAAPAQAGNKHIAGALLGGLVVGAIIGAHSGPVYGAPIYQQPIYQQPIYRHPVYQQRAYRPAPRHYVVQQRCHIERQRVWDPHYGHFIKQKVKVCY